MNKTLGSRFLNSVQEVRLGKGAFYAIIFAILIISMTQSFWMFRNRLFDHGDSSLVNYISLNEIYYSFFVWSPINYTGLINPISSGFSFIISIFNYVIIRVFGLAIGIEIFFGLLIFCGDVGSFLLVYELTEGYHEGIRIFSGFAALSVFSLYFYPGAGPSYNAIGVFLPSSVLFIYLLYQLVANTPRRHMASYFNVHVLIFLSVISLSGLLAIGGYAFDVQDMIIILIAMLFFVSFARQGVRKRLLFIFAAILLLSVMINMSLFVSTLVFEHEVGSQYINSGSLGILEGSNQQNLLSALQIHNSNPYYQFEEVSLLILSLISILFIMKNVKKHSAVLVLSLFISLFIVIFLYANFAPPFGAVFSFLLNNFNVLLIFRYSESSFNSIILFLFSTLSSLGIAYVLSCISRLKNKTIMNRLLVVAFIALIVIVIGIRVYYIDYVPGAVPVGLVIPSHVYQVVGYINSQSGNFNVAALPQSSPYYHWDSWYQGTDIYSYLLRNPVFTGAYNRVNELFFPSILNEYNNITEVFDNNIGNSYNIAKAFGVLGIRYIIVEGDSVGSASQIFSYKSIYSNLNRSYGISFVKRYGNTSIYYNSFYNPLVYPANIKNVGNLGIHYVFEDIYDNSFNITNYAVYSSGTFNSTNVTADTIDNFSRPIVNFSQENPTLLKIRVSNATTPFYLVFRETYDTHWQAYYQNGTVIPDRYHIEVNGFANAWYVDKPGNYTITLYYTLQTYAWITWIADFVALGLTLYIGYIGMRSVHSKGKSAKKLER